jgi:ribosomal protein S18 acetylase RimI-like enzyme
MTLESSGLIIRAFAPSDQVAARRLILAGLAEHFGAVDETRNPDIDDIAANYVDRGHLFMVADDAESLVGTAALVFEDGAGAQVVRVSVASRSRRRGLARALVMRLIEAGRALGLARLWMETNDDWEPAIALYRACGFTSYDQRDGNIYMEVDLTRNPPLTCCVEQV